MLDETWSIKRAFNWTRDYLTEKGDEQARLSTEWLLSYACNLSRIDVYTQFDKPLSLDEREYLREAVRRRAAGEPLQYIVGEAGFRHLTLKVKPKVLIPRPETEVLVDLALEALPTPAEGVELHVLDLCTGSGCIGLALASERPDVQVIATDISPEAVKLANDNAEACNLADRFKAIEADLFEAKKRDRNSDSSGKEECVAEHGGTSAHSAEKNGDYRLHFSGRERKHSERNDAKQSFPNGAHCSRRQRGECPHTQLRTGIHQFDLIVSNPPYIPTSGMDALPKEVADFEPALALHGGDDGLDIARRILEEAPQYLKESCALILELDVRNVDLACDFAVQLNTYNSVDVECDLTGRRRFVLAKTLSS